MALKMRLHELGRRRYENARWWRNLNRWMTPLGLVIIAIVVSLLSRVSLSEPRLISPPDNAGCCRQYSWLLNYNFSMRLQIRPVLRPLTPAVDLSFPQATPDILHLVDWIDDSFIIRYPGVDSLPSATPFWPPIFPLPVLVAWFAFIRNRKIST
jgi:hypothetical protein